MSARGPKINNRDIKRLHSQGMRILAIDPGSEKSAFVILGCSRILNKGILPNKEFEDLISRDLDFDVVVIEDIACMGMPVGKSVFETVKFIGWLSAYCEPKYVYRREIKIHFCGSMKAKDANIRQVLLDRLGKDATKGVVKDMWSALALAVYYQDKQEAK